MTCTPSFFKDFFTIIKCQQHRVRKKTNCIFLCVCKMFIVCYDLAYPTWKGLNNNGYSATTRTTGQCYQLKNNFFLLFCCCLLLFVMKVPINLYPKPFFCVVKQRNVKSFFIMSNWNSHFNDSILIQIQSLHIGNIVCSCFHKSYKSNINFRRKTNGYCF